MRSRFVLLVAALGLASLVGCGGGDAPGKAQAATDGTQTTATTKQLDQTPFCVAIRKLEALGSDQATPSGTSADVLDENSKLAALIEEAAANAPDDAPTDLQSLVGDYRVLTQAIAAASGDTSAAFTALQTSEPELTARLGQADAHRASFVFFAERCGTAPPG